MGHSLWCTMDGGGNLAGKEKEFFDPRASAGVCVGGHMCTLVSLHMMEIETQRYLPRRRGRVTDLVFVVSLQPQSGAQFCFYKQEMSLFTA